MKVQNVFQQVGANVTTEINNGAISSSIGTTIFSSSLKMENGKKITSDGVLTLSGSSIAIQPVVQFSSDIECQHIEASTLSSDNGIIANTSLDVNGYMNITDRISNSSGPLVLSSSISEIIVSGNLDIKQDATFNGKLKPQGTKSLILSSSGQVCITGTFVQAFPVSGFASGRTLAGFGVNVPTHTIDVYSSDQPTGTTMKIHADGDSDEYICLELWAGKDTPTVNQDCRWLQLYDGNGTWLSSLGYSTSSPYAALYAASDERLKTNIKPTTIEGLKIVNDIELKSFDWKDRKSPSQKVGYIAQQVQKVYPPMVATGQDGYLQVSDSCLMPVVLKAIQELTQKVKDQEREICELKTKVLKV